MKTIMLLCIFATIFSFNLYADETGNSGCGKSIILRGELTHKGIPSAVQKAMAGTPNPHFFHEEIYGKNFSALVEGLPEGKYTIEVYLAETAFKSAGKRVFNLYHGNSLLIKDFDIFATAGGQKEYLFTADVYHLDDDISGPLDIRFEATRNYAKFNAITVKNEAGETIACAKAHEFIRASKQYPIPEIKESAIYTDDSLPIEKRLEDLIRRMSLNEKVDQLVSAATSIPRLGLPSYSYRNECLHGIARAGIATVFPQAIGMASMWDTPLLYSIAETIATEGRAKNNEAREANPNTPRHYGLTYWSPNINILRDPRWGRGQETYGEDPFLTGELGVAFIKGLQGTNPKYYKALACAKHFAVHSGPENLRHSFDAQPSKRDLFETYLPQFERAVKDGKVGSIMSSYNSLYGIPAPASKFLMTDLLRDQWGFEGHVVSDCGGIRDVFKYHKYVSTAAEAAALCVKAGNDLNCGNTYLFLIEAFEQGLITEDDIDGALTRVLKPRFQLGLFDSPEKCEYLKIPASVNDSPEHSKLALKAALKSIVLLKNNNVLPLNKKNLKRIAVIGPNASSVNALLGNYNGRPSKPITVLQGIQNEVGDEIEVTYAMGCPLALKEDESYSVDDEAGSEAVKLAKASDLTIFVGGIDGKLEREKSEISWQGFSEGDRTKIELPEPQRILLKKLVASGSPIIYVNMSGSAMAIPWINDNINAIVQAWYPGQNGGTAVADILFGNYNPAGRLPVTFYRSTEDLPPLTNYDMANRTYRYFTGKPLYAFGHGLSYTQFEYDNIKVSKNILEKDGDVQVTVSIKNIGDMSGEEVVQLYVRHLNSPIPQALQSLAGFKRVSIGKGDKKKVEFKLPAAALRYWNEDKEAYDVPSGFFEVLIGSSSTDIRKRIKLQVL